MQVDAFERPGVRAGLALLAVGEPDALEVDFAAQLAGVDRPRRVDHVRLGLQQVEDLVERRHPLLVGRVELGELLDRFEEGVEVADEGDDDADLDRPVDRLAAAVEEDHRGPDRGEHFHRREVGGVEVDGFHVDLAVRFVERRHLVEVARLLAEAANDADAAEGLLQVGGDRGDPLPRRLVGAGGDDAEDQARDRQQREGEEGDQRQFDVEHEEDDDDADQGQGAGEHRHHPGGDQLVQGLDVVGHPRDQDAGAAAGEEADRHRLDVGEDALAQVLKHPRPDPTDHVGLQVGGQRVDDRDGDEGDDDQVEGAEVAGEDAGVDRPSSQVGGSEAGGGGEQEAEEHQADAAAVGPQLRDQPAHLVPAAVLAAEEAPEVGEEPADVAHVGGPVHSFAISSRSSRSRWRKTASASPCSAISR